MIAPARLERRGRANDLVRFLIGRSLRTLGGALEARHRGTVRAFSRRQGELRARLGIEAGTPIQPWTPALETALEAGTGGRPVAWAATSGSSAAPKRIPYTRARLRRARWQFVDAFARAFWALPLRRHSLFVLAPLHDDEAERSLTAHLLAERDAPGRLALLQAPYRAQSSPVIRALAARHGAAAVRLFLITLSNPGVLYATNPSTLSTFFDALGADFPAAASLCRAFCERSAALPAGLRPLVLRLASAGAWRRLTAVARASAWQPVESWAPGLEAYACWTGGYVAPFLSRLERTLPPPRHRRLPMYAMSTETIETVPHFLGDVAPGQVEAEVAFLPAAPGVLYEFLPEEATDDEPGRLVPPEALVPGRCYTLVVSDVFGLRRYQTADVFRCRRVVDGLPDLAFERRRGLAFSFTGEKLTGEQLAAVFEALRRDEAGLAERLGAETFLTCFPSHPPGDPVPHYKLVVARPGPPLPAGALAVLAARAEAVLQRQNGEYRGKVTSGRLGPLRAIALDPPALATLVGGAQAATWEAQFKFLPLYCRPWEALAADQRVAST